MGKTIAIDFDGVIHKYSKGWQDGSIYDEPIQGAISTINNLVRNRYSVIIFSTRRAKYIKKWLRKFSNPLLYMSQSDFMDIYFPMTEEDENLIIAEYENLDVLQHKVKVIPFWKKFWNEEGIIGITNRKLPAHCYIDDRALKFDGDWDDTYVSIINFKTYQNT